MPRKSEIVQMDIQREFCSTMQELREIWDEIGIPDEQVHIIFIVNKLQQLFSTSHF